jgi:hypothetical protein
MANYSFEKGKYGSNPGTIIPFPRRLDGKTGAEWKTYAPAGYLRCDGSVVKADLYPNLAKLLGTGTNTIYKKQNVTVQDDEIQLPDLGSKYIKASPSSGGYESVNATNAPTGVTLPKVGVDVELGSTDGAGKIVVPVQYTGSLNIPARTTTFSGNLGISIPNKVDDAIVTTESMLPHGHWTNTVALRSDPVIYSGSYSTTPYGGSCAFEAEARTSAIGGDTSQEGTLHNHTVKYGSPPTRNISGNIAFGTADVSDKIFSVVFVLILFLF